LLTDIAEHAQHRVVPIHRAATTQTVPVPADPTLPFPPDDRELDSYLQSSHRWVPVASAFGGFLTTVSLLFLVRSQVWALPLMPYTTDEDPSVGCHGSQVIAGSAERVDMSQRLCRQWLFPFPCHEKVDHVYLSLNGLRCLFRVLNSEVSAL
jgi:hypothetical protein